MKAANESEKKDSTDKSFKEQNNINETLPEQKSKADVEKEQQFKQTEEQITYHKDGEKLNGVNEEDDLQQEEIEQQIKPKAQGRFPERSKERK